MKILRHHQQRAYTLIELIIVTFIIALVSGVVLLRASTVSHQRELDHFTRQLKSYLTVAQQQAILQTSILGMAFADQGYKTYKLNLGLGVWEPMSAEDGFWKLQALPDTISLSISSDDKAIPLSTLGNNLRPQIVFLPSGELTPFVLTLRQPHKKYYFQLLGNFAGAIEMKQVGETE